MVVEAATWRFGDVGDDGYGGGAGAVGVGHDGVAEGMGSEAKSAVVGALTVAAAMRDEGCGGSDDDGGVGRRRGGRLGMVVMGGGRQVLMEWGCGEVVTDRMVEEVVVGDSRRSAEVRCDGR
ncbi:hypothetical protein F0562_013394 [Nyssa sinensis]|uniref:Uncharacterized protein n=1 Tax=Nyssa sinensis TaxID=561372 RepID=A0A5J4ZNT1_9ASTE|nr:hypothetical protein F0562_013394 [Nyssa sinensis]